MKCLFLMLCVIGLISSCRNADPVCEIIAPVENVSFNKGEEIFVSVNATDKDGSVSEVRLYMNDIGLVSLKSFPYNYTIDSEAYPSDTYSIRATARDEEGDEDFDEVTIIIRESNQVVDIDGNVYRTVTIGDQIWMQENLKVTHYSDGTPIQKVDDVSGWHDLRLDSKAYCYYDFSDTYSDAYGPLYTFAAAVNGTHGSQSNPSGVQGVCPAGWHLPSDAEWIELEVYLGMDLQEAQQHGWRGTDQGSKLRAVGDAFWVGNNSLATNESGFSVLPGGHLNSTYLEFISMGEEGAFWSSSNEGNGIAIARFIGTSSEQVLRVPDEFRFGFSIRCVKD